MRTKFSGDEIAALKQNPCVFNCTERSVNYTFEFKKRALELHANGISAKEIWRHSGFNISEWKHFYFRCTLRDWKKIVQKRVRREFVKCPLNGVRIKDSWP